MERSAGRLLERRGRRRPSGEPPPLPRGRGWVRSAILAVLAVSVGVVVGLALRAGVGEPFGVSLLQRIQASTPAWLRNRCQHLDVLGSVEVVAVLRGSTLLIATWYRRWRHAVVVLITFALTDWTVVRVLAVDRPDPVGVTALSDRAIYWFPSRPVAALAVTLAAMAFVLVPAGPRRHETAWIATGLSLCYAGVRVVLGADYVVDVAYAVLLGVAAPIAAFAAFVPDDVFPVRYTRSRVTAHLDLGGERGRAIVAAMAEQTGFTVTVVEPYGLEGSGGSSPLRMRVRALDGHLFAKIYTSNHLRADRWYRLGRTLLYGALEDEVRFTSVRRLVEYEDYALRLMDDLGVRVATTYGIVELTPNREYMLVTEFFEGAEPLGAGPIDDAVVDEGIDLIRTLWERGLAHRDIKPANLLVHHGHLQLVDVSGLEVRPTSWRQAVDLANMLLTLALQSDPDRVCEHATRRFTPEEIGEALAADMGLAIPTQLQARLKADPRPILARFRELSPERPPISIQRWSLRRMALLAGVTLSVIALASLIVDAIMAGLR